MNNKKYEFTIGQRAWHCMFGWCTVLLPETPKGKILVNLEADEIQYYTVGVGIKKAFKDAKGNNELYTPVSQIFKDDSQDIGKENELKKLAYNPKIIINSK